MKTLCYKTVFCYEHLIYNDGYIIVEIGDNGKLKKIEGLLTNDYLECNITDDKIEIVMYTKGSDSKLKNFFDVEVSATDFELPLNIKMTDENGFKIKLRTENKITSKIEEKKEKIKLFKENNVFEKERD